MHFVLQNENNHDSKFPEETFQITSTRGLLLYDGITIITSHDESHALQEYRNTIMATSYCLWNDYNQMKTHTVIYRNHHKSALTSSNLIFVHSHTAMIIRTERTNRDADSHTDVVSRTHKQRTRQQVVIGVMFSMLRANVSEMNRERDEHRKVSALLVDWSSSDWAAGFYRDIGVKCLMPSSARRHPAREMMMGAIVWRGNSSEFCVVLAWFR